MRLKTVLLCLAIIPISFFLFNFRLTQVPQGVEFDELNIGYNSSLIARNLRDSNNLFLPKFIRESDHKNWNQPITVYSTAVFFKFFGASLYHLRLVSVLFAVLSTILMFILLSKIGPWPNTILGTVVFITTPILLIQSHLALENIAVLPFVCIWILSLYNFSKSKKIIYLVISGVILGVGIYSYKGMRLIVPVYAFLSVFYIYSIYSKEFKRSLIALGIFSLSLAPFVLIAPHLQAMYPGAVVDSSNAVTIGSYQDFFYPYLSTFDLSFLFLKGDSDVVHSTSQTGMFLLATLPLFLLGLTQAIKKRGIFLLCAVAFFATPLLYPFAGSVYRASRLLALIPPFTVITSLSVEVLKKALSQKLPILKYLLSFLVFISLILIPLNYLEFTNYYWFEYPQTRPDINTDADSAYHTLALVSKQKNLEPLVQADLNTSDGILGQFYQEAYFHRALKIWHSPLPPKSAAILSLYAISGYHEIDPGFPRHHVLLPNNY